LAQSAPALDQTEAKRLIDILARGLKTTKRPTPARWRPTLAWRNTSTSKVDDAMEMVGELRVAMGFGQPRGFTGAFAGQNQRSGNRAVEDRFPVRAR
jgi:hypothetical protein